MRGRRIYESRPKIKGGFDANVRHEHRFRRTIATWCVQRKAASKDAARGLSPRISDRYKRCCGDDDNEDAGQREHELAAPCGDDGDDDGGGPPLW